MSQIVITNVSGHGPQVLDDFVFSNAVSSSSVLFLLNTDDSGGCTGFQRKHLEKRMSIVSSKLGITLSDMHNVPVGDFRSTLERWARRKGEIELANILPKITSVSDSQTEHMVLECVQLLCNEVDDTELSRLKHYVKVYIKDICEYNEYQNVKIGNISLKVLQFMFGVGESFFNSISILPVYTSWKYITPFPTTLTAHYTDTWGKVHSLAHEHSADEFVRPLFGHEIVSDSFEVIPLDEGICHALETAQLIISPPGSVANRMPFLSMYRPYIQRSHATVVFIMNIFESQNEPPVHTQIADLATSFPNSLIYTPKEAPHMILEGEELHQMLVSYAQEGKRPILHTSIKKICARYKNVFANLSLLRGDASNPGIKNNTQELNTILQSHLQ